LHAGKDPIKEHLWQCTDTADAACSSAFNDPDPTEQFCNLRASQWEWTHPHESVRSDLGFFCDTSWVLQASNSVFFLGFLVGAALTGVSADKYGRKLTLMTTILLGSLTTILTATTSSAYPFMICRLLQGMRLAPANHSLNFNSAVTLRVKN
jgi:hypothetical protein